MGSAGGQEPSAAAADPAVPLSGAPRVEIKERVLRYISSLTLNDAFNAACVVVVLFVAVACTLSWRVVRPCR
jgi:hypothetical protein